ncbi:OLC1v1008975C1 [Oldenlandia corymbosa var. corymbosa]|uniref:OLC1v1008975C1 n=1 Tax=Oldenlandia corymbosa var. corymbosa TaxID=529605 RepID=A0AAV1DMV8_OLDCO|nr:OLC1v1008975C1 [Oldenlandia corymbosa var. corymbosa]
MGVKTKKGGDSIISFKKTKTALFLDLTFDKVYKELDSFYEELIDEHKKSNRPNSMDGDIVDLMLQLREINSASISSFQITMDHVKAMLMDVFFAGTSTSSATIVWVMTVLMKNRTIMQKVQAEIRDIAGKQSKRTVDEDDVENLPYLNPAPLLLPRNTMENCILDGYEIRSNTTVYVNAWAIARDPEYWENPDEFLPERFLDGRKNNTNYKEGQDFKFIPFGGGRRGCPGYSMGLNAVELALANLLNSIDWELPLGMKKEDLQLVVKLVRGDIYT